MQPGVLETLAGTISEAVITGDAGSILVAVIVSYEEKYQQT